MYRSLLRDARFSELLMEMDRDRLEEVRAGGCSKCGGPLHSGHFDRKPAGILVPPEVHRKFKGRRPKKKRGDRRGHTERGRGVRCHWTGEPI